MQDQVLISVVTVSYNAVSTIEQTILSVINQTYPHIEYIIIDGGSTDGTVDIIKKYADKIVYWVSESDKGIYDAMNKAIDVASGDYVNFINAGDKFCSLHILEKVMSFNHISDIIVGQDLHIDENDNSSSSRSNKASGQQISSQSTNQPSQQSSQQPPRQLPPTGGGI